MLVLKVLRRLGIDVAPYIVYVEQGPLPPAAPIDGFEQSMITEATIDSVLDRYGASVNAGKWRERTGSGSSGVLLEHDGVLIGYSWASERWFLGIDNRPLFELAPDEAYLFDTFVERAFRSRGIGERLRRTLCSKLSAAGRNTFYSFTLVANEPARRFKRKLAATPIELRVRLQFFGRWFADARLRRWHRRVPSAVRAGRVRRRLPAS